MATKFADLANSYIYIFCQTFCDLFNLLVMSNSALASLTAQYTDSENEDELPESPDSQISVS